MNVTISIEPGTRSPANRHDRWCDHDKGHEGINDERERVELKRRCRPDPGLDPGTLREVADRREVVHL